MKNEKLKSLMAQKATSLQKHATGDFELLNKEQLTYAHGGKGSNCPMLTSCGVYDSGNCGLKVSLNTAATN